MQSIVDYTYGYEMKEPLVSDASRVHTIWRDLTRRLDNILDAHTVSAVAAYAIATQSETTTLVALSSPSAAYYDVWICDPAGEIQQARWPGDRASFDPWLDAAAALRQQKFGLPAGTVMNSELWRLARESVLGLPLAVTPGRGATTAGMLCLMDPDDSCPLDEETLEDLGVLLHTFLERAGLSRRSIQQEIEFAVVHDISYSLTASLNLDNIFQQLSDRIRRTLNVEHLSIALEDPTTGDLVFANVLMGPLFEGIPPVRLRPGQGIVGWVAENAEPLIVNDVYTDKRFFAQVDSDSGFRTDSILAVPLKVEQRVIGVIEAINKETGNFNDNDLRLLEAISAPLAVAIENARLHSDVVAEKRRVETFFASMSEGLMTLNAERTVTMVNEAFLSMLRWKAGDVVGRPVDDVVSLTRGDLDEFLERVYAGDEYPQFTCDMRVGNTDTLPVLLGGAVIHDAEGAATEAIVTFSDLTQIREFERMRDDFFANIIHELRTPLATILMYARLLRQGRAGDDPSRADRFLGVIERESDRLQTMVRQMLQIARRETREFQRSKAPVNLGDVLDQLLPTMADQATEKGLAFNQRVPDAFPRVVGDIDTLYLVFKNLLENAIKFTPAGVIRFEAIEEGSNIYLRVKDQGIGIPEEARERIFTRFYRSQRAVERGIAGTGLGLYMVKEAVEWLGGTIDVESVDGSGTTFTVCLPVYDHE